MAKPVLHNKEGGISGHAMKPIALRCIYHIRKAVDVPIIGSGGVTTGTDAVEMIMAGATAVEIGTAIYYRGIDVFKKVTDEIKQFMKEEGYSTIDEMRGLAHK
jgi:dihydroorotate dehydrogenase (NAD+) catalytic subunit